MPGRGTARPQTPPCPRGRLARRRGPGNYRHDRTLYEFLFGDGEWHPVTICGWRKDAHGRQVVDVEFHAAGATWNESYLYDRAKIRDLGG